MQQLELIKECLEKSTLYYDKLGIINSIKDFKNQIPISTYEDIQESIRNHYLTDKGFVNDSVIYWALTSGTSGTPKYIPITNDFLNDYLTALNPLFSEISIKFGAEVFSPRGILPLIGKYAFTKSPKGVTVGCISGLVFHTSGQKFAPYLTYSLEEYEALDIGKCWEYIVEVSKSKDVRCILASNPAFVLDLIKIHSKNKSISKIDANLLWPKLKLIICQTGGTCQKYIDLLQEIFPNVILWDAGIGASEGYFATSSFQRRPIGVPNDEFYFIEYLPLNEEDTVSFEDLVPGKTYYLVISARNGFVRYNTGDLIKREGNELIFAGRYDKIYSYKGERLTETQIEEAMEIVSRKVGVKKLFYNIKWESTGYCFRIVGIKNLNSKLDTWIDNALADLNINYYYARYYYRTLSAPNSKFITMDQYIEDAVSSTNGPRLLRQEKPSLII